MNELDFQKRSDKEEWVFLSIIYHFPEIRFRLIWLFLVFPFFGNLYAQDHSPQISVATDTDSIIFHKIVSQVKDRKENTGMLLLKVGETFTGTPYVAKTLEYEPEQLVINLHGLDCTTFVESCLALTRLIQTGDSSMEHYRKILQTIRYRNGQLDGFTSRLHYFSEWIKDNERKGFVQDVTGLCGGIPIRFQLNFMSSHPSEYRQLSMDRKLVPLVRAYEEQINRSAFFFIPKDQIILHEKEIQDGDILAITTNIQGMDVAHTGLAVHHNGRLYMLHASSVHQQVELTGKPLSDYLSDIRTMTGIMVARPLPPASLP